MASRYARKLVGSQGEAVGRKGKLQHVYIAVTGDRIWELRDVNVRGAVLYKVSAGVAIPHTDLGISFKTALFAKVVSGSSGEINVVYE